jgi:hypothetical protein
VYTSRRHHLRDDDRSVRADSARGAGCRKLRPSPEERPPRGETLKRCLGRPDALTSSHVTEKQDQQRAVRDHERSEEAHWQVAEAGAEEEERVSGAARQPDEQQDDWENEGGALDRKPRKTTERGSENPVRKLGNLQKESEPEGK